MRKARAEAYRDKTALRETMATKGIKGRDQTAFRQQRMLSDTQWLRNLPEPAFETLKQDLGTFRKSVTATQELMPKGARSRLQPFPTGSVGYADATTRFPGGSVLVEYDQGSASKRRDRRAGQLAATFTHELAVHGKNVGKDVDPDQEHRDMFHPDTRKEYLRAAHKTFNALENPTQKRAFVNSWAKDMRDRLSQDSGIYNDSSGVMERRLGKGEKRAMHSWITQQRSQFISAIAHPEKHDWTKGK